MPRRTGPKGKSAKPARAPARPRVAPRLAKLSPPRLAGAVARERLFRELDRLLASGVAWVQGPPGAGKTTLAASYLVARRRPGLWIQVDRGDADLASFFGYLEAAVASRTRGRKAPLPRFTPEMHSDLEGFARAFARAAFARLPERTVIVLDNVHEADSTDFARILGVLFAELPEGLAGIAVGRAAPPGALAGLVGNRRVGVLGGEALRFSLEESEELVGERIGSKADLSRIHAEVEGWAAGLILRAGNGAPEGARAMAPASHEALFAYFASQVVDHLPPPTRRMLMLASLLPRVTAAAADALSGRHGAAADLEALRRQNLFVDRRDQAPPVYQFHALFREFLRERARVEFTAGELARARTLAAGLAERESWIPEAIDLYLESGAVGDAARVLESVGQSLLSQGLVRTVEGWIARMPGPVLRERPRLSLFLGQALAQRDELAARAAYERAHADFEARGDRAGALVAAAEVLHTIYSSSRNWEGVNAWMRKVLEESRAVGRIATASDALRAHSGRHLALMLRADRDDREAAASVEALLPLLADDDLDPNDRLRIAQLMVETSARSPDRHRLFARIEAAARPLLAHPVASPMLRARYLMERAEELTVARRFDEASASLEEARATCERHGWHPLRVRLAYHEARCAMRRGDVRGLARAADELDRLAQPELLPQRTLCALVHYFRDVVAGDRPAALASARRLAELGERAELPTADQTVVLASLGAASLADGQFDEARRTYAKAEAMGSGYAATQFRVLGELALAARDLGRDDDAHLASGLRIAREIGFVHFLRDLPELARRLCAEALRRGIEPEFARSVIAARGLLPERPDEPDWPWTFRIRTLGAFAIERDGEPLDFSGKTARRPLGLLKLIVASGRRDVSASQAIATLWPDLEGDQAKSAFNVALHRLRKLLGHEEAVASEGGRVALSGKLAWVDAYAFERCASEAEAMFARSEFAEGERRAALALSLYGGAFLADEEEGAWQLVARTRLASKYNRLVVVAGQRWTMTGRVEEARRAYERALELDPVAEEIYRQLMLLLLGLGQPAEALRTYRRCRQMLSVVLGLKPSEETERVASALKGG